MYHCHILEHEDNGMMGQVGANKNLGNMMEVDADEGFNRR